MKETLTEKLIRRDAYFKEHYMPGISVDCVVFGFHDSSLKILLNKLFDTDQWSLPGGYLNKTENLNDAANRILKERTGAENIYLNQFKTFGNLQRSEKFFAPYTSDLWFNQRFISISYYALIDYNSVDPQMDEYSEACEWLDVADAPEMMMDHTVIFNEALEQLRKDLNNKPVGSNLLPEKFTMPELQRLYEVILNKELNRGNFYRKMKRYGILDKLNERRTGGAHKSPDLYQFNEYKYAEALKNGLQESW